MITLILALVKVCLIWSAHFTLADKLPMGQLENAWMIMYRQAFYYLFIENSGFWCAALKNVQTSRIEWKHSENSISLTFNHKLLFNIKHKIKVCHKHLGGANRESLQNEKGTTAVAFTSPVICHFRREKISTETTVFSQMLKSWSGRNHLGFSTI